MIDFTSVSREFRSLVARRRALLTFLGSVFAAMGIFLRNALEGELPDQLDALNQHAFAFYAAALMVPSLVLALRIAKLHGGMVLNGILYARLMQEQTFAPKGDPQRAARHNFAGASFLLFLMADLIAGFSAVLLGLALWQNLAISLALGCGITALGLVMYFRFHHLAVRFAMGKIQSEQCGKVEINEWQEHLGGSLEDVNHDMIAVIALVGLMLFSVFESLSGLGGAIRGGGFDADEVRRVGPPIYAALMVVTCVMGIVIYIRLRLALGSLALQIDPTDRPFRPLRLTDSLLGYVLLIGLYGLSLYVLAQVAFPNVGQFQLTCIAASGAFVGLAAEQATLVWAGRTRKQENRPVA